MSLLSHQSAVNLDKNYWAKAHKGLSSLSQVVPNPLPYGDSQKFETDSTGTISSFIKAYGGSNLLNFASQGIVFSDVNTGDDTILLNPSASGFQPVSLTVSTGINCARIYLDPPVGNDTAIDIVNRNTNNAQIGIYTIRSNKDTVGTLLASTLTLVAPAGAEPTFSADFTGGLTVPNLFVSTINGAQITPSAGNGTYFSSITTSPINTSNNVVKTFSNVAPNGICEGFASGVISWAGATPNANDYFVINFNGGGPTFVDNVAVTIPIQPLTVVGAVEQAYFNMGGFFQTSALGSNATLNYQAFVNTPADYTLVFANGNFRFIGLQ
jgi:hypothetical protein